MTIITNWSITTNSFIVHVKAEDNYKDLAEGFETRSNTSNFEVDKTDHCLKEKIKK